MLNVKENWETIFGSLLYCNSEDPFLVLRNYCSFDSLACRRENMLDLLYDAFYSPNMEGCKPNEYADRLFFVKTTMELIEAAYIIYAKHGTSEEDVP